MSIKINMYKQLEFQEVDKMQRKKPFSIIEMMTVVLIILLLMSLIAPLFINLKKNARTAICKSQLRQIGILMTSYASSYNGYLPNDDAANRTLSWLPRMYSDLGWSNNDNNNLYHGWNGHLLPFIDTPLKNYARSVKVTIDGNVRNSAGTNPPADLLLNGWAVVSDAYLKGGFQDLKVFICPEIHANTYDVRASDLGNGRKFPRIKLTDYSGFNNLNNGDYLGGGIPTTYIANDFFFGKNGYMGAKIDSLRMDEIAHISSKAFLIEGGIAHAQDNWSYNSIYFGGGNRAYNYDLGLQVYENGFGKNENYGTHKLSFVHDSKEVFWRSTMGNYYDVGQNISVSTVDEFNIAFEGKAYMLPSFNPSGVTTFHIVSFIDPQGGETFKGFYTAKGIGSPPVSYRMYDEPEYHYLTGSTDILFGDGSVLTKDQGWLYNNRLKVANLTTE